MRIPLESSVGVIVDVQSRLFPYMYDSYALQQSLRTLIAGLQLLEVPTLVTQQYTKGLGESIEPVGAAFDRFEPIEKTAFSCLDEPAFTTALEQTGRHHIIIAGIEAHVCLLQTSMDLLEAGYTPVVVEDATSSRRRNDKQVAIERMRHAGVVVTTTESILFELCRYSGTDTFKALSRLVK
ncbi:MAG: isochorismatase family protein [Spirochaetaceae bacterium]